ncbi:MAG: AsnC family transcriptional regulator [Pseudomonadota bacterium]
MVNEIPADDLQVDELDRSIIEILRRDARVTNKFIAETLEIAESTVGQRIKSMSRHGIMRVVALRDIRSLGYDLIAHADIFVEGRDARDVALELAPIDEIDMVALYTGSPQIIAQINVENRKQLSHVLTEMIGTAAGVTHVETVISLEIFKYESELGAHLAEDEQTNPRIHERDLDERIIAELERDGRVSNREIARTLDISEGTVRNRMKPLLDNHIVKFGAIIDHRALGLRCSAFLRLSVEPSRSRAVAREIAKLGEVPYVALAAGRFNILCVVTTTDRRRLTRLIQERIDPLDGVHLIDVREHIEVLKHRFQRVRIR